MHGKSFNFMLLERIMTSRLKPKNPGRRFVTAAVATYHVDIDYRQEL